jgi:hypothetical protein
MLDVLKQFVASKKAVAAIAGVVTLLAGRIGLDMSPELSLEITGVVIAYLLGQGLADIGKESTL